MIICVTEKYCQCYLKKILPLSGRYTIYLIFGIFIWYLLEDTHLVSSFGIFWKIHIWDLGLGSSGDTHLVSSFGIFWNIHIWYLDLFQRKFEENIHFQWINV